MVGEVRMIELTPVFDNRGISNRSELRSASFNVWGNSYPAESLPASGSVVEVHGIPFRFPDSAGGQADNLVCRGQIIDVGASLVDWMYLLAAAERRTEDIIYLHYTDGSVDAEHIRVSDFWHAQSHFGELLAFRTQGMHYPNHVEPGVEASIWLTRVPIVRHTPLARFRFPRNPALHIFALTLRRS
jgi:hypothetical protein